MNSHVLIDGEIVHVSPKVMLFDKDGTLIDIHHYWVSMIRLRSEKISQRYFPTAFDQDKIKNTLIDAMGVDIKSGRMKSDGPVGIKPRPFIVGVAADVVRYQGCDISNDEMEILFEEVDLATSEDMLPLLKVLPGVEELLIKLQKCGIQSIIVSTDITSRARKAMEALQLDGYFADIIGADQVEHTKPAPDLANLALQRLGRNADEAIVIGDHLADMRMGSAANVGLNIGVLTGLSDKSTFKDQNCKVVSDLMEVDIRSY